MMRIEQQRWSTERGWEGIPSRDALGGAAQVVFLFGSARQFEPSGCLAHIRHAYPQAHVVGCTTAGEILDTTVRDETLALTAVAFEHTHVQLAQVSLCGSDDSLDAGVRLVRQLQPLGLRHVFVLCDGLKANPSEFVDGLRQALPEQVGASGGFAGAGVDQRVTQVWCNSQPEESIAVAVGFYGPRLQVGVGACGGWESFGPDRLITKSVRNVLFEVDGRPALALYKEYLGRYAEGLPATGQMFPLELRLAQGQERVLRGLLTVDEANQSIAYAGNIPQGAYARFMLGHHEGLIGGTHAAAKASLSRLGSTPAQLAMLVSCNGRRSVLKQRIEEELEAVREVLGNQAVLTGFYSHGEIAPAAPGGLSELHNETMAVTAFTET